MLRAAATVAPRAVFVTGNTTTTAGLTVAISRDGGEGAKGEVLGKIHRHCFVKVLINIT
jgi:DNA replicative helicase MCM subunit Mcm2 (Cdc46/Mcm family)